MDVQNQSPVRIERNSMQEIGDNEKTKSHNEKTRSYAVQLGSSTLIFSKTNESPIPEAYQKQVIDQLCKIEQQKKIYHQVVTEEPSSTSKNIATQIRGGHLGKTSSPEACFIEPARPGGPRSGTVLSQSKSSKQDSVREINAYNGVKGILTDKSTNHLTSNHGDALGIDDPLPPSPNQKPGKYAKIRTRINKENKKEFGDILEKILQNSNTEPYPGVSIRGIKSQGFHTEDYGGKGGFFIGIHEEGKFKGQIKKAQPISEQQLEILRKFNKID